MVFTMNTIENILMNSVNHIPWTMRPFSPDKLGGEGESGTGTDTLVLVVGALLKKAVVIYPCHQPAI